MRAVWKRLLQKIKNICLVDRLLFLFMGMFYLYIGVHLLTGAISLDHAHPTDVICPNFGRLRFSVILSAPIFSPSNTAARDYIADSRTAVAFEGIPSKSAASPKQNWFSSKREPTDSASRLSASNRFHFGRLRTAASRCSCRIRIDIFFLLLFARHLPELSENLTAIISQLRDFVSASIGFLVSCKKKKSVIFHRFQQENRHPLDPIKPCQTTRSMCGLRMESFRTAYTDCESGKEENNV